MNKLIKRLNKGEEKNEKEKNDERDCSNDIGCRDAGM